MRRIDIATARALLWSRATLERAGWTPRDIAQAVAEGRLQRVRRGWYMDGAQWRNLWPESQHLALVVATHDASPGSPVFAFVSAAALHGHALYRARVDRVHTVHPDAARRTERDVVRHRARVADGDIIEIDGIRCTSALRTAWDLARLASPEVSLSAIDSALAVIGGGTRRYDVSAADAWKARLDERVATNSGARGIRRAREVFSLADGRSELPLESVTKLQLSRLGFVGLGLQVPVSSPRGGNYWMDIGLDEANAFFECDGETKYTDEAMRSGRTLEQVMIDEKHREDWVRGTTGRRVLRGGSADSSTPAALAARLRAFQVALPDSRVRPLLPTVPLLTGQ